MSRNIISSKESNSLDPQLLKELHHEYFNTDTPVKNIIDKFGLQIRPHDFSKLFPLVESNKECPYCHTKMKFKRTRQQDNTPYCLKCLHLASTWCGCKNCIAKKHERERIEREQQIIVLNKKLSLFREHWLQLGCDEPIELKKLSLKHKIYLGILLSVPELSVIKDDFLWIKPISRVKQRLLPRDSSLGEIFSELIATGLLRFTGEPDNNQLAYINEDASQISDFTVFPFRINVTDTSDYPWQKLIDGKLDLTEDEFAYWWRWIVISQAQSYLEYKLKASGLSFEIGERTNQVLNEVLSEMSLAGAKYLISLAVNHCAETINHNKATDRYLVLAGLPSNIQYNFHRAKNDRWEIKADKVPNHYSYAELYLYEKVLGIGYEGVTRPLCDATALYRKVQGDQQDE